MQSAKEKSKRRNSDDSSSLDYLNGQQQIDDEKIEPEVSRRQRSWVENNRSSEMPKKVYIVNRKKQKFQQLQQPNQGIFLYKPGVTLPNLMDFCNQTIVVIISEEFITLNRMQMIRDKIYGTDTYTSNSDLLAIAIHAGFIVPESFNHYKYQGVEMHYKIIKPRRNYVGSFRNGICSKSIKTYNGLTLKPESNKMLTSLPPIKILQQYASNMNVTIGKYRRRPVPKNIESLVPIPQTHLTFNMNNEPAYRYNIINIADKGYDRSQFLSAKLEQLVLYLETVNNEKYQLCKVIQNTYFQVYSFSKLKGPHKFDNLYFKNHGSPVPAQQKQVIHQGLEWDEIIWGNQEVRIKDFKLEGVKSFKFYKKTRQF